MTDWNRNQLCWASFAVVALACATPIMTPEEGDDVIAPEGGTGGTTVTGGTLGMMPEAGGTGGGGSDVGGTAMGGSGGSGAGGTEGSGVGGATMGGTASAMGGSGGRSAAGGRAGRAGADPGTSTTGGRGTGTGKAGAGAVAGGDGATGCAKLSVPMNGANDKAHFVISLRTAADLSAAGTTISLRVHVEDGVGGVILAYAQDGSFNFLGPATKPLLADQSGWVTLDWDIGAEPAAQSGIMKRNISRIGIEIKAAPSATWSNPTVVYVDSITVSTPALSFPFGTMGTVSAMAQSSDVSGQVLWLNSGSSDTTATGSSLSWVADCP